jgi:hypothetical protein
MCVFMVRSRVTTEGGSEVEAAIEKAFPAIADAQPLEREGRAHRGSRSRFHDAANPGDGLDHRHMASPVLARRPSRYLADTVDQVDSGPSPRPRRQK